MNLVPRRLGVLPIIGLCVTLVGVSCSSQTLRLSEGQAGAPSAGATGGSAAAYTGPAGDENAVGEPDGSSAAGADQQAEIGGAAGGDSGAEGGAAASDSGQGGSAPALPTQLGISCGSSADCGAAALICVPADHDFGLGIGAPPGGVCTAQCTADADCKTLGAGAVCAALSEAPLSARIADDPAEPRFCMAGCAPGAPAGQSKCHYRDAYACRPFASPGAPRCASTEPACSDGSVCVKGFCRNFACGPRCEGDSDCDQGRACDPATGLCVRGEVVPTPIGLPCDPDVPNSTTCKGGTCLVMLGEDEVKTGSFCTQSCVIGERCGNGKGACQLPRFSDFEVGDIGYCQPTCQCDRDCQVAGDGCVSWGDPELEEFFASAGTCDHISGPTETLSCIGEGGAAGSPG